MRRGRSLKGLAPSIEGLEVAMGHIRIDTRQRPWKMTFYVGNGTKDIPKMSVVLTDLEESTILAAVEEGLGKLRVPSTSSEKFNVSSP